jgi:hypothetical protein
MKYKCPLCGQKFNDEFDLGSHVDEHADPKNRCPKVICWCGRTFNYDFRALGKHAAQITTNIKEHTLLEAIANLG